MPYVPPRPPAEYTLQDYFDIAWHHAVIEKQPPSFNLEEKDPYKICLYRGPNGERCLIGAAIKDEDYKPELEGKSAHVALFDIGYANPDLYFLQKCHDDIHYKPDQYASVIENRLRRYAAGAGLKIPETSPTPTAS
jgi:hypothetical protein